MEKITDIDAAEDMFGPFTDSQWIDIANYFLTGTVPAPDGCTSCDRAFVREIIGKIQTYNAQFGD